MVAFYINQDRRPSVMRLKKVTCGVSPWAFPDSPVWTDGLPGHRPQIALQEVPHVHAGCIILHQKHSRPRQGPLQASDGAAAGAAVPLQERARCRQLMQPDAAVRTAGLGRQGKRVTVLSLSLKPSSQRKFSEH